MNNDIIPITYFPGTGGNFLCHFLISAKLKNKELIKLGDTGNAHFNGLKDIRWSKERLNQTDDFIINFLPNPINKNAYAIPPYFCPVHLFDAKLINESFKRSIRITYDLDDVEDIGIIFFKKFYEPIINTRSSELDRLVYDNSGISTLEEIILDTKRNASCFTREMNMTNILFISWKEYFRGNIEDLITKLSSFTEINSFDFSRESLILWRGKTQHCLNLYRKQ